MMAFILIIKVESVWEAVVRQKGFEADFGSKALDVLFIMVHDVATTVMATAVAFEEQVVVPLPGLAANWIAVQIEGRLALMCSLLGRMLTGQFLEVALNHYLRHA